MVSINGNDLRRSGEIDSSMLLLYRHFNDLALKVPGKLVLKGKVSLRERRGEAERAREMVRQGYSQIIIIHFHAIVITCLRNIKDEENS